jgi:curved DNA-binding protein CbpA
VPDPLDPYKTLQVDPEADPEVIQAAYRRLARKYHPDVMPGPEAARKMVAINRAWALLEDPEARAAHDRERAEEARQRRRAARRGVGRGDDDEQAPPRQPEGGGAVRRPPPPDDEVPRAGDTSRDRTSGRSTVGSGYDPRTMGAREGFGAAGPPPGNPSGSVLTFGRYAGWSIGELGRRDLEYLEWLDRVPIGRPYRDEIDPILRRAGRRNVGDAGSNRRRGLFGGG